MPVKIVWVLPEVLSAGEIRWPAPVKAVDAGLALYGYEREATLLTDITPMASMPPGEFTVAAKVTWLECLDICIPGKAELRFSLPAAKSPATAAIDPAVAPLFTAARRALPMTDPAIKANVAEKGGRFVLMTSGTRALASPVEFFPEPTGLIEAAEPQTSSQTACPAMEILRSATVTREAWAP